MSTRLALALMAVGHLHPQRNDGTPLPAPAPTPRVEGNRPADVHQTIQALAAHWLQSKKRLKS